MRKLGKGKYFLSHATDNIGKSRSTWKTSSAELIKILDQPISSSINTIAKTILYKAALGFEIAYNNIRQATLLVNYRKRIILDQDYQEQIFGKTYFHIVLPNLFQVPGFNQELCDEEGNIIAKVIMTSRSEDDPCEIFIFSEYPLVISGQNSIYSLTIFTTQELIINQSLSLAEKLHVHAKSILLENKHSLTAQQIIIECEHAYNIEGSLKANHINIIAGHYVGKGFIEAQDLMILAEEAELFSFLKAKQSLNLIGLHWVNHIDSQIHAPGCLKVIAPEFKDHSFITANQANFFAVNATMYGTYYLALVHLINTEISLKIAENARFIFDGQAQHQSDIAISLRGQFLYSPEVTITLHQVTGPILDSSRYPNPDGHNDLVFTTNNCKIAANKNAGVFLKSNAFIELQGETKIHNANFVASAKYLLDVAKPILQQASNNESYGVYLTSSHIDLHTTPIEAENLILESSNKITQSSNFKGKQLKVISGSYYASSVSSLHFNSMQIECQDSITFEKGAIIDVKEIAAIKGRGIWNKTNTFQCGTLLQEADLYALNTGHIKAKVGYTIAPLVASFGRISADQYSVSAYASMISGFNSIGTFTDNSIISFSPGLFIQNKLRPPTYTGLVLSLVNTGLTIAGLACPAILPITTIVKFSIN
ncbi:MAG TPA: hypothetical protein VHA13_01360, partial [Gammaproteobacteria bacterium]|nr:hypothetical protein [Gammaproteobacteria bacterium]